MNNALTRFSITSHNVCGINALDKQAELAMFLSETQPAVLVLQEPKLNNTSQAPTMKHYHGIYFAHPHQNTGIIMYIHHTVSYQVLSHATPYHPDSCSTVVGFVWLSCPLLSQPIVLGGVYLSHGAVETDLIELKRVTIQHNNHNNCNTPVFLIGDFNSRHPSWDMSSQRTPQGLDKWVYQHLIPNTRDAPLTLLNTRFHNSRKQHTHINTSYPYLESVIDLAITSHPEMVYDMQVVSDCKITSDHLPITITLHTNTSNNNNSQQSSRTRWRTDASDDKWVKFRELLEQRLPDWSDKWATYNTPTSTRITQHELDTCYQQLVDIMTSTGHETIGTVQITGKHQEWWGRDSNIPRLHRIKQAARRVYRFMQKRHARHPTANTEAKLTNTLTRWRKARNEFEKAVRAARIQCYEELVASLDDGCHKLLWSSWKRASGSPRIPMASVHDPISKSPPLSQQHAINNMAEFLKSISTATQTTPCDPPEQQMQDQHVTEYLLHVDPESDISLSPPFTIDDVTQLCLASRINTALGSDNVSPYFLRRGGRMLHETVFMVLSICSRHGLIPQQLRHAHVMTLYKGDGNTNDPNNYRPISITSIIARMYERLHMKVLLRHMEAVGIPSLSQFGFTKHRSTHDAIYRLISTIVDVMGTGVGDFVPTVFVDISKAYDKVWIDGLLYKLHHDCHIKGNLYYMLRALLKGRTMQVVYNNLISISHQLTAGVPQGSVLAPLLFLIFIHSLTTQLSPSICQSLFADDIALLPFTSGTAGLINLRFGLDVLTDYAVRWKLVFSQKKTQVLFFTPNKHTKQPLPNHTLTITGFALATTRLYTYLGVLLDDRLTFIPHLTQLVQRTTTMSIRLTRMVRRNKLPSFPVIRRLVQCVLIPLDEIFTFGTNSQLHQVYSLRLIVGMRACYAKFKKSRRLCARADVT